MFPIILESTKTKNSKAKAACLEFLAIVIEDQGIEVCGPASQVPTAPDESRRIPLGK